MGMMVSPACRECGHRWTGEIIGPTFYVGRYRCDTCGDCREVTASDLVSDRLRRRGPWMLTREELEEVLGRCACGGTFDADAPVRCPECKSADVDLYGNPDGLILMVD